MKHGRKIAERKLKTINHQLSKHPTTQSAILCTRYIVQSNTSKAAKLNQSW